MKVLWLCNIVLPMVAKAISSPVMNTGGWLTGLSEDLLTQENVDLGVCFPMGQTEKPVSGKTGRLKYYGFPQCEADAFRYNQETEVHLRRILDDFCPDIVHVFGTEYPHSLAMVRAFGHPERTVVNIQGLCSIYALHYYAGLPEQIVKRHTFRDFIKQDSIRQQRKKFEARGAFEIQTLQSVWHVVGRTEWDRACTWQINPKAEYHFCNETLRSAFYQANWSVDSCERHSIFISQGAYPIKGLHFMLEAMPQILKNYPDAILYIAGRDILQSGTWKDKLKKRSYWDYINHRIEALGLGKSVLFTGDLNENEMCSRLMQSNVFVCPSSIENSPNSLGEAMHLGVPCVASDVGGVSSMLANRVSGFTYPYDEPYMLAYYICEIFRDDGLALKLSQGAKKSALKIYDRENNLKTMMRIYGDILAQ